MEITDGITVLKFSIKKYGKWFLKYVWEPCVCFRSGFSANIQLVNHPFSDVGVERRTS